MEVKSSLFAEAGKKRLGKLQRRLLHGGWGWGGGARVSQALRLSDVIQSRQSYTKQVL